METKTQLLPISQRRSGEKNNGIKYLVMHDTGSPDSTAQAYESLGNSISEIENKELQPALKSASTSGVDTSRSIEDLRQQALKQVGEEFKAQGNVGKAQSEVNRIFDDYKKSYGDSVSLEDENNMKRGIRQSVNFNSPKLDSDVSYHIGQVLQKDIESSAEKFGLPDVGEINQRMGKLINAQKTLKNIEGKVVKSTGVGKFIRGAATVGGEALGEATGVPIAGALVGRRIGTSLGNKLTRGLLSNVLERTGKNAVTTPVETIIKRSAGLLGSTAVNKARHAMK